MKTTRTLPGWLMLLALSTLNLQLSTLHAQGTAFSYQGQLQNNGSPATGVYDLRFTVCDALTNGNIVAGPVTNSATGVSNGLFAVTLDFGGGVFTGANRWLQIGVRTNGNGAFTNLSPCQAITPVPYALYAQTSSSTNQTLTGSGITLGGGGTSWDIGVVNNALTFSYGDPLVTLTNTPDGSLGVPKNITAGGNITADGGLQIGGTNWTASVGNASGPAGNSFANALIFSANSVPYLDVANVPGYGPFVWSPNGLGATEVDTGELKVQSSSWNSWVVDIDGSGDLGGNEVMLVNGDINVDGCVNASSFNGTSDRNLKEKFTPIDNQDILERVASLPISSWNFKTDEKTRHIGPMAQDFHAAFNVGTDDKHIATVDEDGVALAAIQGLNQKLDEQLKAKDAEIQNLKARLEKLEQLINGSKGGEQ